jgi:hypothetical protein
MWDGSQTNEKTPFGTHEAAIVGGVTWHRSRPIAHSGLTRSAAATQAATAGASRLSISTGMKTCQTANDAKLG